MAILRNSYVGLLCATPSAVDVDSGPIRLVPNDADPIDDHNQRLVIFGFVEQQGAGTVRIQFLTSFGDGFWLIFGERTLDADELYTIGLRDVNALPPYVRVRVTALPPEGSEVRPTFLGTVRFASNAPFRGEPASVPVVSERYPTDDDFLRIDSAPPEGDP